MGSWLFVDSKKVLMILGDRPIDSFTLHGLPAWTEPSQPYSGGRGSFGGGGATGDWEAERPPPTGPGASYISLIYGDADCPPNGRRYEWVVLNRYIFAPINERRDYSPHTNGPFQVPIGWWYSYDFKRFPPDYQVWSQTDNCPAIYPFADTILVERAYGLKPCIPYGSCDLVPVYPETDRNLVACQMWADQASKTFVNSTYDSYKQTCGDLYEQLEVVCTPARRVYVPVFQKPWARSKQPEAREDREESSTSPPRRSPPVPPVMPFLVGGIGGVPLVPPPFAFGTPLVPGAPVGPPTLGEGGFRKPEPPKKRTRERKKLGALKTIFRLLDVLSESAEIGDCVYKALPKATRQRWEKAHKPKKSRGLLDQAGQYGIAGMDWKAGAIWHNQDKVDWNGAIECMVKNHIEDKIIGAIARVIPPQAGVVTKGYDTLDYVAKSNQEKAKWARIRAENAARVAAAKAKHR